MPNRATVTQRCHAARMPDKDCGTDCEDTVLPVLKIADGLPLPQRESAWNQARRSVAMCLIQRREWRLVVSSFLPFSAPAVEVELAQRTPTQFGSKAPGGEQMVTAVVGKARHVVSNSLVNRTIFAESHRVPTFIVSRFLVRLARLLRLGFPHMSFELPPRVFLGGSVAVIVPSASSKKPLFFPLSSVIMRVPCRV